MKKRIVVVAVAVAVIAIVVTIVASLLSNKPSDDAVSNEMVSTSLTDDCWEYVTNISYIQLDDGTTEVTLTAPDYTSLMKQLADETSDVLTNEHVIGAIKSHPESVKEYVFVATTAEESDVKAAFKEQLTYELVALTLEGLIGG